jgi:hypothetical protein
MSIDMKPAGPSEYLVGLGDDERIHCKVCWGFWHERVRGLQRGG